MCHIVLEATTSADAVEGCKVYRSPSLLQRRITRPVGMSLTEKPKASNSMEEELSRVN
jgi:hypothetical protein